MAIALQTDAISDPVSSRWLSFRALMSKVLSTMLVEMSGCHRRTAASAARLSWHTMKDICLDTRLGLPS